MKLPLFWLKDYVDIDCSPEELEEKLFSCGFEVEEVIRVNGNVDKIVTCKVIKIEKHPNADKLSVTQVDAGKYGVLQIVTNATNIYEGAIVPVALDGSTLASGDHITAGKIRGVESFGMFCSGEELGINDDWYEGASTHGVLIFKEDFPLGEEVKKLLDSEYVMFDINVTANRPDCQSILGLAREVAAVLDKPLKSPDFSYAADKSVSTCSTVKVTNNALDLCPRYISHLVTDIKIADSPMWIKRRLSAMGLRSINNIVDITNFVLLEIGQPMHAFDLNDLSGNEINVRRANDGEKIITLDDKEFSLSDKNLVIADAVKPVALAGVMGGQNSGIKENTSSVLFESAKFARDNIRKTSRTLGQRSDSSSRYEKGVDFLSPETGMKRALNLISTLGCGKISADEYDIADCEHTEKIIKTTFSRVNGVLGIDVPKNSIKNILERLNFGVTENGDKLTIRVPLYREDMESYQDIAEEIIREYGYSHLEPTLLKTSSITLGGRNYNQTKTDELKELLVGYGFNEIITYSFVSEKEFDMYGFDKNKAIKILNPISEDMAVMRASVLPSVVRAVCYNLNRKNQSGRLFEIAKVYTPKQLPLEELPDEHETLSFSTFGEKEDFFSVKGIAEGIIDNFCNGSNVLFVPSEEKYMHPTRSADIYLNGERLGVVGQLNPELAEKLGSDKEIYVCEMSVEILRRNINDKIVYKQISKFPSVERDLAVIVDANTPCEKVVSAIKEAGGEYLDSVSLFDVYQGGQIEKDKKSMAFNLVFVATDRTLNVEEVDGYISAVLENLKTQIGAELR